MFCADFGVNIKSPSSFISGCLSDLSDFKNIRAVVPEDISTFLLRLCVAKLQDEGFPKPQPINLPSEQHQITWIEPQVSAGANANQVNSSLGPETFTN